jgi:GT2 family glycosyltransferase
MTKPRVCILVLNWNGAADTIDCLESLKQLSYDAFKAIVIDNGSSDDSVIRIKAAHPDIEILELPTNLLFGGGNNAGLAQVKDRDFDFVIFLNNDTLVESGLLEPLLSAFQQDDQLGIAGPLICYANDPETIWYGGGIVNLWTGNIAHRGIRRSASTAAPAIEQTDYITGCCMMMPMQVARELQGFDPWFSMYGEDVDLSLRCRKAGYHLSFVPQSKMYHKVSASVGGEFGLNKLRRKALGMLKIYLRHTRWYQWPVILISLVLRVFFYAYIYLSHVLKPKRLD